MQTYTVTHYLDGHEVATYEPRDNHDAIKVQSPDGMHYAALILGHSTPAPLRLAFLRSLAHAAEELAEQIEIQAAREYADRAANPTGTEYDLYADKDRGTALAAQHIAEMKAAAFGGGDR